MMDSFPQALIIAFREGMEAFLIIAILLKFLDKTNNRNLKKSAQTGTVAGVIASLQNTEFEAQTFKHVDFKGQSFSNSSFKDCVFENCNLSNIDLSNTQLQNAKLLTVIFWQPI